MYITKSDKSSAEAETGDRDHNRHGRKEGGAVPLSRTAGTTSNTMWPVPRSTSVPSGVFIRPPFGHNRHNISMAVGTLAIL